MARTLPTLALALGLLPALSAPALACGGFFCMRMPMDQAGERILFVADGYETVAHVQIRYQGDAKKFSWVVPTPTEPKLGVGSDVLFAQLENSTRPQFQLNLKNLGDCEFPYPAAPGAASESMRQKKNGDVEVISQEKVGPYDSAVIRSNDPAALKTWLRKNGYEVPPKLDPLLDPYVAGKYYFVALKLQQDRASGDLQPITLRYRASKPGIPIRLTAVAATPDMDLYVWVLGRDRAIPENYRHARINEAKVDWLSGGSNYRSVVTQAANEAGGQAFVTDYAGDAKVMDLDIMAGKRHDLARLGRLTDPVLFLRAVQDDGYFQPGSQNALAFVRRYVPIPKDMKDVWEPGFYSNPEQYREQLAKRGVRVDAARAAAELEETVVKPFRDIRKAFDRHPYLTRMYTTMSPEEMTQDPLFRFTAILPDVSNVHKADGVRDCRKVKEYWKAPVTITLQDGTRFTVDPSKTSGPRRWGRGGALPEPAQPVVGLDDEVAKMPAAIAIEQLKPDGPVSVIRDNSVDVRATLDRVERGRSLPSWRGEGFGCAHTRGPAPASQGGGEGVGLAALVLGLIGWRRWRR